MIPTKTDNSLSKNLKTLRKYYRISQEELSQELGISRNKIASYESRNVEPSISLLVKMAKYFKISIDDLLRKELNLEEIEDYIFINGAIKEKKNIQLNLDINKKTALSKFVEENKKVKKIITGLTALNAMQKTSNSLDTQQLLGLLEYLIEHNQKLILEINSTNN